MDTRKGGLAAWGVAELETNLHDPNYLGAVSVAGAMNLQTALTGMASGRASAASFYLPFMAFAAASSSPDSKFVPAAMLTGAALDKYEDVTKNGCWYHAYASFLNVGSAPLVAPNWHDAPALQHLFKVDQLATLAIGKPMLVIGGEADMSVPFFMVKDTTRMACRNGIKLTFRSYPGLDHDPVMEQSTPDQLVWIKDRFADKPALNSCPALVAAAK
jgi:pimeloyl-ACP methyl ester carboxylesterase